MEGGSYQMTIYAAAVTDLVSTLQNIIMPYTFWKTHLMISNLDIKYFAKEKWYASLDPE